VQLQQFKWEKEKRKERLFKKRVEKDEHDERINEIQERLHYAEQATAEMREEQEREFKLRKELRRLKQEDISVAQ